MDLETYQSIPEQITLREIKFSITEPGFRTKSLIIMTTLTDPTEFSTEAIAQIYGYRWNAELDIRRMSPIGDVADRGQAAVCGADRGADRGGADRGQAAVC